MAKYFLYVIFLIVFTSCFTEQSEKDKTSKDSSKKKVLFLAGGRSHSVGEHEHNAGCLILAKALNNSDLGFEARVISKWPNDLAVFDDVDAVVVYADAGGKYKDEQLKLLDKKIKAGMGIMFLHYGVHPSKEVGQKYFIPWIGGYFETGFSVNPHWSSDLAPKANHPIGRGIEKSFLVNDEFYLNIRFPTKEQCSDCYPLAQGLFTPERVNIYNNLWNEYGDACFGKKQTLMWCRDPKTAGRGIGFTGGHFHHNWAVEGFRKMVLNGIVWIARSEVPKEGVVSAKVTDKHLNENLDGIPEKPLKAPVLEDVKKIEAMLRPKDPKNYDVKKHHALVKKMKKQSNK